GYVDGPSIYGFAGGDPANGSDPFGLLVVLIHGVNTNAEWFARAREGLVAYEKATDQHHQAVIEFTWGDRSAGENGKQGGRPNYATDSVEAMYSSTPDRKYMIEAVRRLKRLLDSIDEERMASGSTEPVTVVAHSQGSIITLGA